MATITNPNITQQIANLANSGNIDVDTLLSIINSDPNVNVASTGTTGNFFTFKRFGANDKVDAKVEVVTEGLWSGGVGSLNNFYTASAQSAVSKTYYYNVYNLNPQSDSTAEVQFAVAYGHVNGSGSVSLANDDNSTIPSKATYAQYRSLLLNNSDSKFQFENSSGVLTDSNSIYAINLNRNRFKEEMDSGNWSLTLTGANGTFTFIDDSGKKFGDTFGKAGRIFKVVSGSLNIGTENEATINTATAANGEGYGLFYPDRGIIILNPNALQSTVGNVNPFGEGAVSLAGNELVDAEYENHKRLFRAIEDGGDFECRRTENVSTQHFFVRATNREFNYSNNPSYTNDDGTFVETSFEKDPKTFVTTVGLYNDTNELIAVAKTSQPIPKDFSRELLIKVKLSF